MSRSNAKNLRLAILRNRHFQYSTVPIAVQAISSCRKFLATSTAIGQTGLPAISVNQTVDGTEYSLTLQILILMTVLTLLPSLLIMMTSFVRIIIVMSLLRQAISTAQTPNTVLVGISLFLSFFIMSPIFLEIYDESLTPYLNEQINAEQAIQIAEQPLRDFMLRQTREDDLTVFSDIAGYEYQGEQDVPLNILLPSFMTSELKTAFTIGFLIYIPFVIIDLVVASVLMSMGMMMLSPMMISMPFKLMLFVLADGWILVMQSLAGNFGGRWKYQMLLQLAEEALIVTIMIAGPLLGGILLVGVIIGILQAATSIRDDSEFYSKTNYSRSYFIHSGWLANTYPCRILTKPARKPLYVPTIMFFSSAELVQLFYEFLYPFTRISSFLLASPFYSIQALNLRFRIATSVLLTALYVSYFESISFDPLSVGGLSVLFQQAAIGISLGFSFQLVTAAITLGGQAISNSIGLSMANMVDPTLGNVPTISQLLIVLSTLIFSSIDGHLILVELLFA